MARYAFSYTTDGFCELYAESTPDEEALDVADGVLATDFTGNGYLAFWKRCMKMVLEYEDMPTTAKSPRGIGVITDLDHGTEKRIA